MRPRDFNTILVHVDDSPHTAGRLALARQLAQRHGARLVGAYVAPSRVAPFTLFGWTNPDWSKTIEDALSATESRAQEYFVTFSRGLLGAEWLRIDGNQPDGISDPPALLARAARRADLAIVGQIARGENHDDAPGRFAEGLIVGSGRPVLVLPDDGPTASVGENVLIAWSERPEAVRAVSDAIPMLRLAKKVEVVEIAPPDAPPGEREAVRERLRSVVAYLAGHHVRAELAVEVATGPTPAEQILMRAAERHVDLVIAGAYGHARLREFIFGGFSHDLLSRARVPVLVAH